MQAYKDNYESVKNENNQAYATIKKIQFNEKKKAIENEVRELIEFKQKAERLAETMKKKHKKQRKIFDDKDYNLMH